MTTHTPIVVKELRCWRCEKLLAEEITPPYKITCPRCRAKNLGAGVKE